MRRREFIALAGASVTWPFAAMAQQPGRTYRLGCLLLSPRDIRDIRDIRDEPDEPSNKFVLPLFDGLRRQGFVEGQNLKVDYRGFGSHIDLLSQYAAELVAAHVNVILAAGPVAIRAAQHATKTIPIVGIADDLIGQGLVNSMARPGGNITGVSILATELDGKRQEILAEAVPGLRRMAVLADLNTSTDAKLQTLRELAGARGIELSIHRVATGEEIGAAIDAAKASDATALNALASPSSNYGTCCRPAPACHVPMA
jgi:putative ABC transport system substrate-binding protein